MAGEAAVGTVKETRVSLQRVIPMVGNSFKPVFVGRFEETGGKVVLRGSFSMSRFTRLFMAFWFGALIFSGAVMLVGGIGGAVPDDWIGLSVILAMIGLGLGLVKAGQWFSRKDTVWLSNVIASALGASKLAEPVQPPRFGAPAHLLIFAGLIACEGVLHLILAVTNIEMPGLENASPSRYTSVLSGVLMLAWAYGICRLHRFAWWGGLAAFAYWGVSIFQMDLSALPATNDLAVKSQSTQIIFVVVGLLLLGLMGRWWYAQHVHFQKG